MHKSLALASFLAFVVGIFAGSLVALPLAVPVFILFVAAVFLGGWFFGKRDAYFFVALILLLFAVGTFRAVIAPRALPPAFAPLIGTQTTLEGTIVADPDVRESNQRDTVEVTKDGVRTKVLAVADRDAALAYGDQVTVSGTLTKPEPFATDGDRMFAYDAYLAKDGIFAMEQPASVSRTNASVAWYLLPQRYLYDAKHMFASALETALPEPAAALAEGLITGGKQGLGKDLLNAFTIAGLLPIVVLSGYNVMIVADSVLAFLGFLRKRTALVIAGLSVLLFVLAAGGGASALRALLMAMLALYAKASGRTYNALRALFVVFILMLLVNPLSLVYDPGFQFSFAATLGLVLLAEPLTLRFSRIKPSSLREVIATTLAAQLFVLPLLLYQTGNLSFIALPANILILPFIPFTMLLSFIAAIGGLVVPFAAIFIGLPAYFFLSAIVWIAETGASLPFAHLVVPAFPAWLLIVPYVAIAWFTWKISRATPPGRTASRTPSN